LLYLYRTGGESPAEIYPETIVAYAAFQNALDDCSIFNMVNFQNQIKTNKQDDGFYRATFLENMRHGADHLLRLKSFNWSILKDYDRLLKWIVERQDVLIDGFAGSPFAWIHHDFDDYNLIGWPQKLIDWGSSYGYGPYLYDISPYLLNNQESLRMFSQSSWIWARHAEEDNQRSLMANVCARFVGFLNWNLDDFLKMDMAPPIQDLLEAKIRVFKTILLGKLL